MFLYFCTSVHEPLQKTHNITSPQDMKTEINLDIEENSPFQEGVIFGVNPETG